MEEERELRREIYNEINQIRRANHSFKKRVCIIANLFIPGLGFVLYGSSYIAGLITSTLFYSYLWFYFSYLLPNTDIGFLYSLPAVIIWIISMAMVSNLDSER